MREDPKQAFAFLRKPASGPEVGIQKPLCPREYALHLRTLPIDFGGKSEAHLTSVDAFKGLGRMGTLTHSNHRRANL